MDDNHSEQITQYAKLSTLYETIIYLQKEIVKEQGKLEQLKLEEQTKILFKVVDKLENRISTLEKVLASHAKCIGEMRKDDE